MKLKQVDDTPESGEFIAVWEEDKHMKANVFEKRGNEIYMDDIPVYWPDDIETKYFVKEE